ncbi:nuclear transport factor 2 family protein [Ktedonospora formicarum]|uniref:SnoaL-like domain-containing protein n=1 Tax=Ktedonospora formicarum TaxID=2778364 RepID=A0A8J3I7S8_9CHLR|nr:nuclear transport factor 2 family protein [Ktedonospora formicarum]GHO48420.1 hypothetical protein KSX_65830 [Ktedonospora formicarum]
MSRSEAMNLQQLVENYMALWNEADAEKRRAGIASLYAPDGVQYTPQNEYRGYEALEVRVSGAYEQFVNKGGFLFQLASEVQEHHGGVTFTWKMVPAAGGGVAGSGTIFWLLNENSRIIYDYHF